MDCLYLVYHSYYVYIVLFSFFFFKQKTAYEMRISDWNSDVCSSDLSGAGRARDLPRIVSQGADDARFEGFRRHGAEPRRRAAGTARDDGGARTARADDPDVRDRLRGARAHDPQAPDRASDRLSRLALVERPAPA